MFGPGEDGDRLAEGIPVVDPPAQEIRDGTSIVREFAERTTQSALAHHLVRDRMSVDP